MKTIKDINKEFDKILYPIIHSNTHPEKDKEYLERVLKIFKAKINEVIDNMIGEERGPSSSYSYQGESPYEDREGRGYDKIRKEYLDILGAKDEGYNKKVKELKDFKKKFNENM